MDGELFAAFVRRWILCLLLLLLGLTWRAHGQNAGVVGIATKEIPVFAAQTTSASSGGVWQCNGSTKPISCPVLPDIGAGSNFLSYCTTNFIGTIDLEWSPTGAAPWLVLVQASYGAVAPDTACRTPALQIGGYWPNLRSTVTITQGSISAWYTGQATAIAALPPALGSNGPSSPPSCDQNASVQVLNAATAALVGGSTGTSTTIICGFTISFQGAPTTGTMTLAWSATTGCASSVSSWNSYTTSSTPQTLPFPGFTQRNTLGSYSASTRQTPCFTNNSGVTVFVNTSYAEVPNL
jgi:hypothetical protein